MRNGSGLWCHQQMANGWQAVLAIRLGVLMNDLSMLTNGLQSARIWDASTGETKADFRGHDNVVEAAVFAPASAYPAIRELAGIVSCFKYYGIELTMIQTPPKASAITQSLAFVATGSRDKTIKLWDGVSGQCLRTLVRVSSAIQHVLNCTLQTGHDNWIRALVFHPTGKYLLSASDDKTIRIWDLKTGRCTKTIDAHGHFVTCLSWGRSPIGTTATSTDTKANGTGKDAAAVDAARPVNVIASGSVDQVCFPAWYIITLILMLLLSSLSRYGCHNGL